MLEQNADSLREDPVSDLAISEVNLALAAMSGGVVVGTLVECPPGGLPRVQLPARLLDVIVEARPCVPVTPAHVGRSAVLVFDGGRVDGAIVLGVLQPCAAGRAAREDSSESPAVECVTIDADRKRTMVSAGDEIVLRCGAASITLTRAGKVLIRGAYVSTHSSGVQRIKGATVEIN